MDTSEAARLRNLSEKIQQIGLIPDELLLEGYDAIAIHSNSIILYTNSQAAKLFGYQEEEMNGLNAWTLFAPASIPTLMSNLAKRSETPYVVMARHRDGNNFPIEIRGINFTIDGDNYRAVLLKRAQTNWLWSYGVM